MVATFLKVAVLLKTIRLIEDNVFSSVDENWHYMVKNVDSSDYLIVG